MKSDDESCEPDDGFGNYTVQIDLPGGTAKVKTAGGGTGSGPSTGTICAKGSASDPTSKPQSAVYQLMPVGSVQQPKPPGGLQSTGVDGGGDWQFDSIGGVSCGPSSNPVQNQLGVWVLFSDNNYGRQSVVFDGVCATATDCEGSGGGIAAEGAGAGTAVETVARQWSILVAEEETHTLAIFQEPVILTLRPNGGERCVWDNGANGVDAPLVELSCEIPLATVWQVLYRHGTVEIRYIKLAAEINALGSNRFAAHPANARHKAVASPTSLLVVPV